MRYLLYLIIALISFSTLAQERTNIDLRTYTKLKAKTTEQQLLGLLVQGDEIRIKELVKQFVGTFKYNYGNISSVELPSSKVLEFAQNPAVERIENMSARGMVMMDDTARMNNNIDSIHKGFSPLMNGYSGKGVVVGIIDGGIYWQQPDFKRADGSTRIRYIWDQVIANAPNAPQPYNYGQEWTWIDINANKCTHTPEYLSSEFGHGTCVAGIAAGNGRSLTYDTMRYRGIAYEADIIAVRIPLSSNSFLTRVADAVDYIFKKADALGKPCVINTSVGTYYGSRDGGDMASKIIDSLLEKKKGRVLTASAGNGGHIKYHVRHDINNDSAVTYFRFNKSNGVLYFDFWADSAQFNRAEFVIGAVSAKTGNLIDTAQTEPLSVLRDFNPTLGGVYLSRNLFVNNGTQLLGKVEMYAEMQGSTYHVESQITPVDTSSLLYWKLQSFGTGALDLWSTPQLIGGTAEILSVLPNLITKTDYRYPDSLKTMVSSWQNSDKVITVANYTNRAGYWDIDSIYRDLTTLENEIPGKQYRTSSNGPTRDNRLKPDISATGSTTLATGDLRLVNGTTGYAGYVGNSNRFKIALGGKHIRNGGTSMASPVVAGLAALYLEKRPTARWDEIKDAIINSAKRDTFTGPDANFAYGYGKLNAFKTMNQSYVYGCKDTGSINYQPTATLDTGGCIKKVYGCTDAEAINFSSTANVNNGTCIYETSIEKITLSKKLSVRTYPNPFGNETAFSIDGLAQQFNQAEIIINDMIGRTEDKISITKGIYQYRFANQSLPSGVHLYKLVVDGKTLYTGKVVKY